MSTKYFLTIINHWVSTETFAETIISASVLLAVLYYIFYVKPDTPFLGHRIHPETLSKLPKDVSSGVTEVRARLLEGERLDEITRTILLSEEKRTLFFEKKRPPYRGKKAPKVGHRSKAGKTFDDISAGRDLMYNAIFQRFWGWNEDCDCTCSCNRNDYCTHEPECICECKYIPWNSLNIIRTSYLRDGNHVKDNFKNRRLFVWNQIYRRQGELWCRGHSMEEMIEARDKTRETVENLLYAESREVGNHMASQIESLSATYGHLGLTVNEQNELLLYQLDHMDAKTLGMFLWYTLKCLEFDELLPKGSIAWMSPLVRRRLEKTVEVLKYLHTYALEELAIDDEDELAEYEALRTERRLLVEAINARL